MDGGGHDTVGKWRVRWKTRRKRRWMWGRSTERFCGRLAEALLAPLNSAHPVGAAADTAQQPD